MAWKICLSLIRTNLNQIENDFAEAKPSELKASILLLARFCATMQFTYNKNHLRVYLVHISRAKII